MNSFENEPVMSQKVKKNSSQKLKVYSNSGKSSSSQKKQIAPQANAEVKTQPFLMSV